MLWFGFGAILGWPLAVFVGKFSQTSYGGVPVYPNHKYITENVEYDVTKYTRKKFRKFAFLTCCITGATLANTMADSSKLQNKFYNRPDFKPKAAMVKDDPMVDQEAY